MTSNATPTVSSKPLLMCTEELYRYSLGPQHPMGPDRVRRAMELADYFNVLEEFDIVEPRPARTATLELAHSAAYIQATRAEVPARAFGLGTEDNPISHGLSTVAARIAGGTVEAAQAVWEGRAPRAVNLAGGLHHAMEESMAGFCMYNDAAIAIQALLDQGAQRVAYVDLDAHHGDGVERIFYNDPRVLTISIHESGLYLFPHTGFAHEIGGPGAEGTAVNIALPRHASDEEWLQAVHAVVAPLLAAFRPQILFTQHGADPYVADPLADLDLSIAAMVHATASVRQWAQQYCDGKWVALGGGGYRQESVARLWAQVLGIVAGADLPADAPLPEACAPAGGWATATLGELGLDFRHHDSRSLRTHSPGAALSLTSRAVFPYWGLAPY